MPRVLDLTDVLQLVVDRLNQGSLVQQDLIKDRQQPIPHILAVPRDQLQTLLAEQSLQPLRGVATIPYEFAGESFRQFRYRFAVIDIAWGQMKSQ